jgi:hypothetical protein
MATLSERVRTTIRELFHGEEVEELEANVDAAAHRVFRSRIALAIVLVSILSAVAGWRASVFDEQANAQSAVYYQDLLVQQRLERQHEARVAQDITQYGELEQDWFLGHVLSDPQAAEQQKLAADQTLHNFEVSDYPTVYTDGTSTYDPAAAYARDVTNDTALEALHPAAVLEEADRIRDKAVNMTFVAALFVASLVLLTLAQVTLGRRARGAWRLAGDGGRWTISHTFMTGGMLVALTGLGLFISVLAR